MIGLGTILNVVSIIVGSVFGVLLKNNLKDNYKLVMIQGVGLIVIVLGIGGALNGLNISTNKYIHIIIILSVVIGGVIGTYLRIGDKLNQIGNRLQEKFGSENSQFSKGLIDASLIFCVGAMAIIGSINDGMNGDYTMLAIKAILDGITSMVIASKYGIGVLFSFIPVLIYQGVITIIAYFLGDFVPSTVQNQMTIIGNLLIIGIGLELVEIKKIKIADMLPAILMPILYYYLMLIF